MWPTVNRVRYHNLSFSHKHFEIILLQSKPGLPHLDSDTLSENSRSGKEEIVRAMMWTFMNVKVLILPLRGKEDGIQVRQYSMNLKTMKL